MSTTACPAPPDSAVLLDTEQFDLRERPPSASRAVRIARNQLLSDLDLTTLSDDLSRVSRLLTLSRTAACAAGYLPLANHIAAISNKVLHLFDATASSIAHFRVAADAVLSELAINHSLMSTRALPTALHNLASNDDLARTLSDAARALSADLASAADDATRALESAQSCHAEREADRAALLDRITELNVRKAAAWETHGMMLESLSEAGRLYTRAARIERRAARRAQVFGAFGFVEAVDRFLFDHFGLAVLTPFCRFLDAVRKEAAQARVEKRALLDAKKRQRHLNREALADITDCSRRIREVKSDVDAVLAVIESLHAVAKELKRLSVVVMRVSSFWSQLQANMGRLSSSELVRLIRLTAEPALGVSDDGLDMGLDSDTESSDKDAVEAEDTLPADAEDTSAVETSVIDVSVDQDPWVPCGAVKRKLVTYYARWVALADVCGECLREVISAKSAAVKSFKAQAEVETMSPEVARQEVTRMAADLRREMEAINAELDQFRDHLTGEEIVKDSG